MKKNIFLKSLSKFFGKFISKALGIVMTYLKFLKKKLKNFDETYPDTSQKIQLSFIYFFALIDLIYSVLTNIFSLGYLPSYIEPIWPFIKAILESSFFKVWGSPEKVFLLSYIVLEVLVTRSIFKMSKFAKYNILLVFALLMVQGLIISLWDTLFHREITDMVTNWTYDEGMVIGSNKELALVFFVLTFLLFSGLYYFFYTNAINGTILTFKGLYWLTDSVAFWLRIKTPTMRPSKNTEDENSDPSK